MRQRNDHLSVVSYLDKLLKDTSRDQRFHHESADEERKKKRETRRTEVLLKTETAKSSIIVNLVLNTLLKKDITMMSFEVGSSVPLADGSVLMGDKDCEC